MTVLKSRSGEYTAMEENNHCETLPSGKLPGTMNAQTYIEKHNHLSTQSDGDKEEENESCGWGAFRPALCQKFRDPKWVLFWLCWAGAIQTKLASLALSTFWQFEEMKKKSGIAMALGEDVLRSLESKNSFCDCLEMDDKIILSLEKYILCKPEKKTYKDKKMFGRLFQRPKLSSLFKYGMYPKRL